VQVRVCVGVCACVRVRARLLEIRPESQAIHGNLVKSLQKPGQIFTLHFANRYATFVLSSETNRRASVQQAMKVEMNVVELSDIKHALSSRLETVVQRSEYWSERDERLAEFNRDEAERIGKIIERLESAFTEWLAS